MWLFVPVAIFNQTQFRRRTSSNNWHADRITASEELQYRRRIGLPDAQRR
jgi:hypothetical protein